MLIPEQYYLRYRVLFLMALLFLPALSQAEDWVYRIRPGETLSGISIRYLLPEITSAQLQTYNKIEEDRAIPIGTEIRIPLDWLLQSPAGAEIVFFRGQVDLYRGAGQTPAILENNDRLQIGDRLVTGSDAVVSIRFADGSRLLLGPQSEITLDTLSAFGETGMIDTRLRVHRGRVESRVRPLHGEGSRYEIHTPAAVTMVRGTGFRIGVEGDSGLTRNEVTEGDVAVAAGGETVSVTAGFGTLIEPGKPPSAPTKLLPAPDLSGLPAEVDSGAVTFEWLPLDEAKRYRLKLQVSGDGVVLHDILTETASHTLEILQPGEYQLVIRGIDELGLEGLTARHALQVNLRPLLATPDLSALPAAVEMGPFPLKWLPLEGAERYRIKLHGADDAESVLLDSKTADPAYTLDNLQPGEYQLSISGIDVHEREGASGLHRLLVYPPRLATPDLSALPAAVEMGPLPLKWLALEEAESYRIKLHAEGDADSVLLDSKTGAPSYLLENLQPGSYQLSISGIDVYEREGKRGLHRLLVYPPLLALPDLSVLPAAVEMGPLPLKWLPLEGAESYRIKLHAEGDANSVLLDSKMDDPSYTLENLQSGEYQLSISGIDVHEREGASGLHRLLVYPPRLATPDLSTLTAAVEPGPVAFQWSPQDGAESYRVRVHPEGKVESVLLDSKTEEAVYTLENLQPGYYQLSISGIDAYAREGASGLHRLLVYPPRLATPDLSALPAAIEPGPVAFQWSPQDGAESYRVRLHPEGKVKSVLLDSKTEEAVYTLENLQPGYYQLSISGIDAYAREGASGLHRLLVYPPQLATPDLSALPAAVEPAPVTLQWPAQGGAESYRVKLHRADDAESVLLDSKTADPAYTLENLQTGEYQLAISGIDAYAREGANSLHRLFVYPPRLATPDLSALPAAVEPGPVVFQWLSLDGAVSYRVKLHAVDNVESVLLDSKTADPAYTLENLQPGEYQLAISGIDIYKREGTSGLHRLLVYPPLVISPDLSGLPATVEPGPVVLNWKPLDGAVGYRVKLYSAGDADAVLLDRKTDDPDYILENLRPGDYQLAISGIDAYGREGVGGLHNLRVFPALLTPPNLSQLPAIVEEGSVTFRWTALAGAESYRYQLGREAKDGELLHDVATQDVVNTLENLQPGTYELSVWAIDAYGRDGQADMHAFQVKPIPLVAPDLSALPDVVEEGAVMFQWPALDRAVSYRIQMRSAGDAAAVLDDFSTKGAGLTLEDLQPGTYQLSIKGMDVYGLEGLAGLHDLQVNRKPRAVPVLGRPLFGPGWMALSWSQVEDAWGYRLLIARDSSFQDPLFERIGLATQLRLPFYWQGRLYVRVDALFQIDPPESHSGVYRIELPWR